MLARGILFGTLCFISACGGGGGSGIGDGSPGPAIGAIQGTVRDAREIGSPPVVGAQVALTPGIRTTTTNGLGAYSFTGVLPGAYLVTATKTDPDFAAASAPAVVVGSAVVTADISIGFGPAFPSTLKLAFLSTNLPGSVIFSSSNGAEESSLALALPEPLLHCRYNRDSPLEFVCEAQTAGNSGIFLSNPSLSMVTTVIDTLQQETHPDLSPDGTQVVYATDIDTDGNFEIFVINRDGSAPTLLVDDFDILASATNDNRDPSWSPDGANIVYSSRRTDLGATAAEQDFELRTVPAAGGPSAAMTTNLDDDRDPAWHPNSTSLVYAKQTSGTFQIFGTANPPSSPELGLTTAPADSRNPVISFDGIFLAWTTSADVAGGNPEGNPELTVARISGPGILDQRLLTQNLGGVVISSPDFEPFIDLVAPTVTSVLPENGTTEVALVAPIQAFFSEGMDPATITSLTFTLVGPGVTPVPGAVSLDTVSHIATFTPDSSLPVGTAFTATLTTGAADLEGNFLAASAVWSFTTVLVADTAAPTVLSQFPADTDTGIPQGTLVQAFFDESLDPATITSTTFTLTGPLLTPVPGVVTYVEAGSAATFTPDALLALGTVFTATLTTGIEDPAGNPLAPASVWTFTTTSTSDTTTPTVTSVTPTDGTTDVPLDQLVLAVFSESMDPGSITSTTFTLSGPGLTPVDGTVSYDPENRTAKFSPGALLLAETLYTATITTGAEDLTGNPLAFNLAWTFTTTAFPTGEAPVVLGSSTTFVILAGSTVTNTGPTIVNGDFGLSPGSAVTGFPPGTINGSVHTGVNSPAGQAKLDLTAAYNDAAGRSTAPITVAGNLGGQTLAPGLYRSTSSLAISGGDLTLDAQGNANAVFIFQMASTLTVTVGRQVILAGNAKAANVYWQVGTSATLGTNCSFKGNILSDQSITLVSGAALEGRALTRIGAVTMAANVITFPAP